MLVDRKDRDGVATLWLNRPDKLNALNVALFQDLQTHVEAIAADTDNVGCVVLRGEPANVSPPAMISATLPPAKNCRGRISKAMSSKLG